MHVTVPPPTQIVPSSSRETWTRPARPSAVPWAATYGALAQWLLADGRATAPYVASQGTALGRAGRVHVTRDEDGTIWVGGGTVTCVTGQVEL